MVTMHHHEVVVWCVVYVQRAPNENISMAAMLLRYSKECRTMMQREDLDVVVYCDVLRQLTLQDRR
jgi:hypothetical protein